MKNQEILILESGIRVPDFRFLLFHTPATAVNSSGLISYKALPVILNHTRPPTLFLPVYMFSGSRDNLTPELPWARYFPLICLKNYINRLHEVGETTWVGETTRGGELSRLSR